MGEFTADLSDYRKYDKDSVHVLRGVLIVSFINNPLTDKGEK